MTGSEGLTRDRMAWRVAGDIPGGSYVNLGIGMPERVAHHLPRGKEGAQGKEGDNRQIVFHSENGILGLGPPPPQGEEDFDLISAGKKPATAVPGSAFFDSADSFAMIRGGHIDIAVLGAFQVSESGDLANWTTGGVPAVGGAMDLAQGARQVFVITDHTTKSGEPKIVKECTYPLTGAGVVTAVYTNLAVIDVTPRGLEVRELVEDLSFEELQQRTGAPLTPSPDIKLLLAP
ncbi:MAG: 3-oxoadipate CoA-transferase [Rhodospirillaceae bacterium]|jgi:3-oxoadipate CoA-transferase beta subunit|nr:3-oxoadipate CoA-transferase [Rhodospirillaceae bacterium]|tara:strand:+ start:350 stop:1048 length:699 start_codon:yes stop_codon:yes gene_type:complete